MKFLIDAHLPRRLAYALRHAGHEATHTLDLPHGNSTPDSEINDISDREQCVVVTKDADFVSSFHLTGKPYKLLLVSTGNINNADLETLFAANLPALAEAFQMHRFIELTSTMVIIHL
jgi:predicted nuclease of predicted toxin-antitoxin system